MTAIDTNSFAQKYSLRETREYANYIDGKWVKSKTGEDVRESQSRQSGRPGRQFSRSRMPMT